VFVQSRLSLRGLMDRSPLARELGALGPQDLRAPPGAGTQWCASCWDPRWAPDLGSRSFLVLGTRGHLWELGPDLGFGAQGELRVLGRGCLMITWPFCKVQVLGPRSDCRSSLQRLGLPWLRPLCDQHHAHNFNCSHDVK
jgi:hypothetical protein